MVEKLFGGLSMTCDFADLVQNGFYTRPVAPLQGSFGPRSCTSLAVSRLNIHPPNSFSGPLTQYGRRITPTDFTSERPGHEKSALTQQYVRDRQVLWIVREGLGARTLQTDRGELATTVFGSLTPHASRNTRREQHGHGTGGVGGRSPRGRDYTSHVRMSCSDLSASSHSSAFSRPSEVSVML